MDISGTSQIMFFLMLAFLIILSAAKVMSVKEAIVSIVIISILLGISEIAAKTVSAQIKKENESHRECSCRYHCK